MEKAESLTKAGGGGLIGGYVGGQAVPATTPTGSALGTLGGLGGTIVGSYAGPVGAFVGSSIGTAFGDYAGDHIQNAITNHINSIPDYQTGINSYSTGSYPGSQQNDPFRQYRDPTVGPVQCFAPGTMIAITDDTASKIEELFVGSYVLSFEASMQAATSDLGLGRVKRLFQGSTTEWYKLSCGLVVTPGHRFLNENGLFETIVSIIDRKGSIVRRDGALIP